jgi:gamma-polyglutamate biosynthesis protein CapA
LLDPCGICKLACSILPLNSNSMKKHVFILLYVFLFVFGACAYALLKSWPVTFPAQGVPKAQSPFVDLLRSPDTKKIPSNSILFVGDIMLARNVENLMRTYGYQYPFSQLQKSTSTRYLVGNFEATIPKIHVPTQSMQFSFSVHSDFVKGLQEYGFTHLSLANNHSYDFGSDSYEHTKKIFENHALNYFGDQRNQASSTIAYVTLDEATVALLGIYAVDTAPTKGELDTLFTRAAENSDIQIAYIHFGAEYVTRHNAHQEKVAYALVDAGADVVIGHHPHVVQDIQLYKDVPIFYSLGNFIFDQYFSTDVQEGLTLVMIVEPTTLTFKLVPVTTIGSRSAPRNMGMFEKDMMLTNLAKNSDALLYTGIKSGGFSIAR